MKVLMLAAALALPLGACATTLTASGAAPYTAEVADEGEPVNYAASVTDVIYLKSDAKLFFTAGGDPAINGLYTYYATWQEGEGGSWKSYFIGDFNSVDVVRDTPGETGLRVSQSEIDANGEVKTATRYLLIPTPGKDAAALKVIPAKAG